MPFWALLFLLDRFVRFLMWLVGYWWCKDCKRRFFLVHSKHKVIYQQRKYIKGQIFFRDRTKKICEHCYAKFIESQNEQASK